MHAAGLLLHRPATFFDADACIHRDDMLVRGKQGVDIHLLDLRGEAQEGGETHNDFGKLILVDALLAARALDNLVGTEGTDHGVGFFVGQRGKAGRYVLQYLDEDTAQAAEHHVAEFLFVLGADEQLRTLQHGLHHDGGYFGQLHHTVEFQCQMLLALDVEHHAADVRLVDGAYDLRHHGEARAAGKGQHFLLFRGNELVDQWDARRAEQRLHLVGRDVAIVGDGVDDAADARHVHAEQLDFVGCGAGYVHDARQHGAQRHLVGKVHVALLQEVRHLGAGCVDGGQDGENGLAARLHRLVQHVVHLEHCHQPRRTEDGHHGVDVLKLVLAVVQAEFQVLGRARGKDINGVAHGGAGIKLCLQFVRQGAREARHVQSALAQGVGQHHARPARVGDDGEVLAAQLGQGEDAAHGGQLLARVAAHDACLAEEGLDGGVAAGDGARVRAGRPAAALAAAALDGGDAAAFLDERRGVEQQAVRVADALDIEQLDM